MAMRQAWRRGSGTRLGGGRRQRQCACGGGRPPARCRARPDGKPDRENGCNGAALTPETARDTVNVA